MPAILIATVASAGIGLVQAKMQANAAKKAAAIQTTASDTAARNTMDSTARALDYVQSARNAPAPSSAFPAYNGLMGGPRRQPSMPGQVGLSGPGPGLSGPPGLPSGYQALFGPGGSQPQGMVTLRDPAGNTKQVPESEVANYPWAQRV